MIWIVVLILAISLAYNFLQYKRRTNKNASQAQSKDLILAIDQVGRSGSSLPDLSLQLTSLAATNLKSVESFRNSTDELSTILQNSVNHYNQIDELGRQNIVSIRERIDELQGFMASIEELNKHNHAVSDAVNLLENISSQTNMLALNASVEAARAGEGGKGFSVIAKSVRDLASESIQASDSIKKVIEKSKTQGKEIAERVTGSTDALKEIFDNINQIVESLSEGLRSFEANSSIVNTIHHSANELDDSVRHNLSAVRESSHIGIRLGIYLDDLYAKSTQGENKRGFNKEFIKPAHVFHYNFTNTLPSLLKWLNYATNDLPFPSNQDSKIQPADVYQTLRSIYRKLDTDTDHVLNGIKTKGAEIQPIDVLKLSVAFCERIQQRSGKEMLNKQLVIQYNEWKSNRTIVPSDVLFLIKHFDRLLDSSVKSKT